MSCRPSVCPSLLAGVGVGLPHGTFCERPSLQRTPSPPRKKPIFEHNPSSTPAVLLVFFVFVCPSTFKNPSGCPFFGFFLGPPRDVEGVHVHPRYTRPSVGRTSASMLLLMHYFSVSLSVFTSLGAGHNPREMGDVVYLEKLGLWCARSGKELNRYTLFPTTKDEATTGQSQRTKP